MEKIHPYKQQPYIGIFRHDHLPSEAKDGTLAYVLDGTESQLTARVYVEGVGWMKPV